MATERPIVVDLWYRNLRTYGGDHGTLTDWGAAGSRAGGGAHTQCDAQFWHSTVHNTYVEQISIFTITVSIVA